MKGTISFKGKVYPILNAELHIFPDEESRWMFINVDTSAGVGFTLCQIELKLLEDLNDLDRKRIHVRRTGETYDDDTLGTDIVGMHDDDLNQWSAGEDCYGYGDILIEFEKVEGQTYRCRVEVGLTDLDLGSQEPAPEGCPVGAADFVAVVNEGDPLAI